jgi:hypothetical protein
MPKKLTYEYVKEYIEKEGYVLLSTEYINSNSKLLVCCSKEHEVEMRFNDFKHGHRCITCGAIKKELKSVMISR